MEFPEAFLIILLYATQFLATLGSQSQWYGNNNQQQQVPVPIREDQKPSYGGNRGSSTIPSPNSYLPPTSNTNARECRTQEVARGRFKVICGGTGPTILRENILWLSGGHGGSQFIDIEVPNYAIREVIKAGFKSTAVGGSTINVLLKRPQTHVDAQVEHPKTVVRAPQVNIQYERPQSKVIHFPVDQSYNPLRSPILPPLAPQFDQQLRNTNTQQQSYAYGYSTLPF